MSAKAAKSVDPAAKQFPGQHDGETVKLVFHQHPLVMRKQLIIGLLAILLAVLPLDFPQVYANPQLADLCLKLALMMPVIVLGFWFYRWVGWYYSLYIVTDQRIVEIKQKGFFDRTVGEWQLSDISNVNYHVNGFQAVIFGFGDIMVKTYIGDLAIKTIHHPADIHGQLLLAVREANGGSASLRRPSRIDN